MVEVPDVGEGTTAELSPLSIFVELLIYFFQPLAERIIVRKFHFVLMD